MRSVAARAAQLAPTDAPTVSADLLDVLEGDGATECFDGVDKAATPADRVSNREELAQEIELDIVDKDLKRSATFMEDKDYDVSILC